MKKILWITMSYYLLQGIIHNLGHVVTPVYVSEAGIARYMFGFFFSAMSLGLLIGAPVWGVLGDGRKKRPFIVLGLIGYSIGQVMFVSTNSLVLMTFFRFFSGFSVSATMTLMLAHVIQVSSVGERTKYLSISAAFFALGTTFGYQIGGWLGDIFILEVFYIQAVTNLIYAMFVFVTFKEVTSPRTHKQTSLLNGFKDAAKLDKPLLIFLLALTLATTAATNVQRYLDAYVTVDLGRSTSALGSLVLVTGLVGIFTNFVIVPLITKLKKDFAFMTWLQVLSAVVIFFVFRSEQIIVALYTGYMFYIVLKSIYQPLEQNYISLNAKDDRYSSIMGVRQAFFALGMVLGPLMAGFLYDVDPILVFDVSAAMFLLAFIMLVLTQKAIKKQGMRVPKTATHHLEPSQYKASP